MARSQSMYICNTCISLNVNKIGRRLVCNDCGNEVSIIKFNKDFEIAREIVRFGFQYRKRKEYDSKRNPNSNGHYYLKELHDVFTFFGLAIISGITGNFAYDKLKKNLDRLIKDPLIIEIQDKDFQRFLKSENQQKKFIKYIVEYRNKELEKENERSKRKSTRKNKKIKLIKKNN